MDKEKALTQVTVKLNPQEEASIAFFRRIKERNRDIYPTIFSYLNAAVETLEISADTGRDFQILTDVDLQQIELIMLDALRIYDAKKKEERMLP